MFLSRPESGHDSCRIPACAYPGDREPCFGTKRKNELESSAFRLWSAARTLRQMKSGLCSSRVSERLYRSNQPLRKARSPPSRGTTHATIYPLDRTELFALSTDILNEIRDKGPNRRKFSSVEMQDPQLRIHGDTAVATYVMRYSEQRADGALNSSIRESAVFVRRDGRWLRILEQRNNLNSPR